MSAKETGIRKDAQGLALGAMNQAALSAQKEKTAQHQVAQPTYIGASGKPNFARRNG